MDYGQLSWFVTFDTHKQLKMFQEWRDSIQIEVYVMVDGFLTIASTLE